MSLHPSLAKKGNQKRASLRAPTGRPPFTRLHGFGLYVLTQLFAKSAVWNFSVWNGWILAVDRSGSSSYSFGTQRAHATVASANVLVLESEGGRVFTVRAKTPTSCQDIYKGPPVVTNLPEAHLALLRGSIEFTGSWGGRLRCEHASWRGTVVWQQRPG